MSHYKFQVNNNFVGSKNHGRGVGMSKNFLVTGVLVSLSKQQLVDCDHECDPEEYNWCDAGCNGGLMNNFFEYTLRVGGLQTEKDHPYNGGDGACEFNKNGIAASVSNFVVAP